MEVFQAHDDETYWLYVGNNDEAVVTYLVLPIETDIKFYEIQFSSYFNASEGRKDFPYYIKYKQPSEENEEILGELLEIFYPDEYEVLFDKMMELYKKMQNGEYLVGTWKYEGQIEGRK